MARRRIEDKEHNEFVRDGVDEHRPTKIATERLLADQSSELGEAIHNKQQEIVSALKQSYGAPFFEGQGFVLFNDDCASLLKAIQEAQIQLDLTVTSPPYNIGKEYEQNMAVDNYVKWCASWMNQIYETTSTTGAFWLNLGYFEVPNRGQCVPITYLLWDKSPFYLQQEVVWHYGAGVSSKKRLCPRNEKWLFYIKDPKDYVFNLDDIRDPNVKYPNQKKNGKFRCNPLGKNPSDVWEFPKVTTGKNRSSKERCKHPAQFPLKVIERIILASSNQGQVVFDPFAGSCSTGIAAMGLNRVFVGSEINAQYCEMAVERYERFLKERKDSSAQCKLF